MARTKKQTRTKAPARGKKTAKPRQEMAKSWSILLFGVGLLLTIMAWLPGESAWAALRMGLFGVCGVGTYLLGPFMLYWAVLVAFGQPVRAKCLKGAAFLVMLCGVVMAFSGIDLAGLDFAGYVQAVYKNGQSLLGGGVLGGVVGGSLLVLCGRIAARVILIILLLASVMLVTGVTPGDVWQFLADNFSDWRDDRQAARVQREQEQAGRPQPEPLRRPEPGSYSLRRRRAQVDIDLGPDPVTETDMMPQEEPDKPLVGPGGTFGMFPPAPAPVEPPAEQPAEPGEFETVLALPWEETAPAEQPAELDSLVKKAMGEPGMAPAVVTTGKNDQLVLAAAGEGQPDVYRYPPLTLFEAGAQADDAGVEDELRKNAELLVHTLESFGVKTKVLDICRGPSVTRYELQPLAGVKISRITSLADDIALNLATAGVRIEAPIPGKPAVGIEVPNRKSTPVGIRSIFEAPVYTKSASPLTLALGKDIAGAAQVADLCKMPHLLIAGSTGSGKSVCVNSIIISFLYKSSPEDVKLILIDPKVVELAEYNGIPHLLMPVVTEPRKAAGALGSAVAEMERRYHLFAENNVRDIKSYNRLAAEADGLEKLPYIAIVIDELADLMMVAGKEVEDYICRIAQKARAAGMHLIVATQRPSVDVITGLIKANIPSRIAFAVSSQVDSRTILDAGGAEKLLGMGDMLFMPVGAAKPVRIQGTYVKDSEIGAVLDFIKKDASAQYDEEMISRMDELAKAEKAGGSGGDDGGEGRDPMLQQAAEVVIEAGQASTSLLQRRCKLGYARAARIMDEMEQMGIIGPYQGAKPREVLINRQQWIEMNMRDSGPVPDEI